MSEQPGNVLTLPVNRAVNPTDVTQPSVILHRTHASPDDKNVTQCLLLSVWERKSEWQGDCDSMREEKAEKGREGEPSLVVTGHPDWFQAQSQPGFGGNIRH